MNDLTITLLENVSKWWSSHKLVFYNYGCHVRVSGHCLFCFLFTHFLPACSFYMKTRTCLQHSATKVYEAAMQQEKLRKGPWHEEEDELLIPFVTLLGERRWDYIAKASGLKRSGKSCRLRWLNYLCPNIKHGYISTEEEQIIIQLHKKWSNKWSRIAQSLPGRTDNEIKNYWRTHIRKKIQAQEQENFRSGRNHAKQDFLFRNLDFNMEKHETNDEHKPRENTLGTDNSFDVPGFPNSAFTSSPYEIRILDWMSELSDDDDSNIVESCFCCRASISEFTDIWAWSGSIWDMN